jgi:drug/metabolite transporter (DMT)-like permease
MDGSVASPRPLLAIGLRLGSALALATMSMLLKLADQRGSHLLELIFWRQAITLVLITLGLLMLRRLTDIRTQRPGAHLRRALFGITGMVFVYGAVILLPLAEATTISFTAPMFAVLLSVLLFGEKVGRYRWTAVALGFAGVLIVAQPGMGAGSVSAIDPAGAAVGLVAAFLVALISFQIQDLNKTESPWSIVFRFCAFTAPLAALAMPFVAVAHDPVTWSIIGLMALCGAIAQILLTASLRFGSAATIIIFDYTALLWATFYGWSVFDRIPSPTLWIGAPLIIAAGITIVLRERRGVRRAQAAEMDG